MLLTSLKSGLKFEMNPLWQQKKLTGFCKENSILVTAYSPLGAFGNNAWGHNRVMECDVLQDIAKSKGKTVAQVSLYCYWLKWITHCLWSQTLTIWHEKPNTIVWWTHVLNFYYLCADFSKMVIWARCKYRSKELQYRKNEAEPRHLRLVLD